MMTIKPQDQDFKEFYSRVRVVLAKQLIEYLANFNPDAEPRLNKNVLVRPFIEAYTIVAMRAALRGYNEAKDSDTKAIDGLDFLQAGWKVNIVKQATERAYEASNMIDQTTKKKIKNLVIHGKHENLNNTQLANLIDTEVSGLNEGRARNIARTESTTSSNFGKLTGAESHFKATGEKGYKYWVHGKTKDPRETHEAMTRQKPIEIDKYFDVDGEKMLYPGDHNASAGNRCNCFCTCNYISESLYNRRFNSGGDIVTPPPRIEAPSVPKPARVTKPRVIKPTVTETPARGETINVKSILEGKKKVLSMFKEKTSLDMSKATVSMGTKDLTLDGLNVRLNVLNDLLTDYEIPVCKAPLQKLSFSTSKRAYGYVDYDRVNPRNGYEIVVKEFNFGSIDSPISRTTSRELAENVLLPADTIDKYTVVHEFGHVLTMKSSETTGFKMIMNEGDVLKHQEFWRDARAIELDYKTAIQINPAEYRISRYAHTNSQEFIAESFTEYRLHPEPSKYAKMIGQLIDKHFKKK